MSEKNTSSTNSTQPDKDLAAKEHPRPSQAEGDRKTIEEDLKEKSSPSAPPQK